MASHCEAEAIHLWQRQTFSERMAVSENMTEKALWRQSSPAGPSTALVESAVRQKRRAMSTNFTDSAKDAAKGYRSLRRDSRSVATCSHYQGRLEDQNPRDSDHASPYEDIAPTSPLIQDVPSTASYSRLAIDEAGHTNQDQPSSRTTSSTRRLSREFSSSNDLAYNIRLACNIPAAVTKDAGKLFTSSCFICAKALADYWKPPKNTAEHRRVEFINVSGGSTPLHTPSFSTGSGRSRSGRSSRSSRRSTYMDGRYNIDIEKAERTKYGTRYGTDIVTIYGATEWGHQS